uniref:midnolin-like n=1 Tax=Doryrhamphus excisus TaxID=161450 RepID=UPI0025ADFFFA|nr:midnolin-like [Doryrhamphus excisus]
MRLLITSTSIGCPVEILVPKAETLEGLKTRLSRQLQVQADRIVLLHKDKQLTAGKLLEQGIADGSSLTLQLPAVAEAALFCSGTRAERVVEALESLTECQISDFLSGLVPLTLKLAMGSHMMDVQLQLSSQDVAKLQLNNALEASNRPSTSTTYPATYSMQFDPHVDTAMSAVTYHQRPKSHHSHSILSTPSACSAPASTPVYLTTDSSAAPQSPLAASTFTETAHSSTVEPIKQAGAVIESFFTHAQGVFSGTFSGTLALCNRSGLNHPRRGIAIILQILDDFLRAASRYQVAQVNPSNRKEMDEPLCETPDEEAHRFLTVLEENQTMHRKVKRLQFLMDRRHHKRTLRSSQLSHPYQHHHPP